MRGGAHRSPEGVLEAVNAAVEDGDGPVLSVFCVEVPVEGWWAGVHEACEAGDVPHRQVQVSSVGLLESAGFALVADSSNGQPACHHHVVFGNDPKIDAAELFVECFSGPYANPTGGKKRR